MSKKIVRGIFFMSVVFFSSFVYGAIPPEERAVLITLYQATNGDNWSYNIGWKEGVLESDGFGSIGSEDTWAGITVYNDHVIDINLPHNGLSGSIPPELGNLSYLKSLSLFDNQLEGSIPKELGNLSNLESLFLGENQLSGNIPTEVGNLSHLNYLYLNDNHLNGSIPPELGNLSNLLRLQLDHNQLSGSIPPELGNLDYLSYFYLHDNQLSGSIPPELGNLKVWEFYLYKNRLTGPIPPELGNLIGIKDLYLFNNQLSGSIPSQIGNLNTLRALYLQNNQLNGSIPPEIGNMSHLKRLNLTGNQLGGTIPSTLTNLANFALEWLEIGYNGFYANDDTVQAFLNTYAPNWEASQTIAPTNGSAYALGSDSIKLSWTAIPYTGDSGGYQIYYSTTPGGPWTYAGKTDNKSVTSYNITGLIPGTTYYMVVRTQTDPHSQNSTTLISDFSEEVSATTSLLGEKEPPFGTFTTPIDDSIVYGSIPITGWALDDSGIDSVIIYREEGNGLVYIGDALLVEGARPDVAAVYPTYPNNTKAGWGYMLLTNFLPNSGNGTVKLHVIATDHYGKSTTLGVKTIICDNANAVEPFGTIETPFQGGIASGNKFINWGWILTPPPNAIPIDGTTINVWVNGINLGNPIYNIYRSDIATLFPGYANSEGATGYFYLDTTAYKDGVHTIQWTVTDNSGNSQGIGSRYFSVKNSANRKQKQANDSSIRPEALGNRLKPDLSRIPIDYSDPVGIKKGYGQNIEMQEIYPDENGMITIEIHQLQRLEIHFFQSKVNLSSLPIGSSFAPEQNIFYWQPGPGFLGEHQLNFLEIQPNGQLALKKITIRIVPCSQISLPSPRAN